MTTLSAQLLQVADSSIVDSACRTITETVELTAAERAIVLTEVSRLCAQMVELSTALADIEDEPDLYRSLAALWLELRFTWQRHNLVANYNTIRTGTCSPMVLVRASVASYLLDRMESLLERDHRDQLGDTAVQLLDVVRDDIERGAAISEV